MRKNQPDYAKAAEPAALFPDPRLAVVVGGVHRHGERGWEGGGTTKTCVGAFRLVLEPARHRKRAFLMESLISPEPTAPSPPPSLGVLQPC